MLDGQRYFCITRPRRFGKSVMANMVGAFFGRTADGKDVFDNLEIAKSSHYREYLHKYDVIYIDFSRLPRDCSNYWTSSGPYDEIFYYIRNNIEDVRDDLAMMVSGERVGIKLQGYAATSTELHTKNQIFSAMVVYGLLTYEDGEVFIPNRELMDKFDELLLSNENLGYIHNLARESERMLKATLAGDTGTMAEILKYAHDTEPPIFSYNSEIELSAIVNLVYLAARDKYRVECEDKAGEGYVDFIFYPERKGADALILELKTDSTPEDAITQIRNKNYALRFKGKMGKKPKYTGRILGVGISYNKKKKEHSCKVEVLKN